MTSPCSSSPQKWRSVSCRTTCPPPSSFVKGSITPSGLRIRTRTAGRNAATRRPSIIQGSGVRADVPFLLWAFLQPFRQAERQGKGPVPLKGHLGDDVPPGLLKGHKRHRALYRTPRHGQVLRPALLCKEPQPKPLPHGVHLPLHRQRHGVLPPALFCLRGRAKGRQARHVPRRPGAGPLPLQGQKAAPPPGSR